MEAAIREHRRGRPGEDLCGRLHARTKVECVLPDTHYPRPHYALDGTAWHDALCGTCHGGGTRDGDACADCGGVGFALLELSEDEPRPGW
ncbi:hypothetical protein LO772_00950 [Yinghuangia sp. ASG 101]|uniref:hypothetical protein n=1 Tax=Yinghuangia sp. ASG 101 TaxID=2896848 RepID=UPI001E292E8A|nr:hypothetical protein [Yinghuangia sp. ASG 101]UGQ12212.1 hypothetical protein LO772_00950 [Yinghuangia sp. ASG 101]